jgi:hypothetical protein
VTPFTVDVGAKGSLADARFKQKKTDSEENSNKTNDDEDITTLFSKGNISFTGEESPPIRDKMDQEN